MAKASKSEASGGGSGLPVVQVVAGLIRDEAGRILLATRPPGKAMAGLWEFPGGKIEPFESPEAALARELREELGIELDIGALSPLTFASHSYPDFHLLMPLYLCRRWEGVPSPREGQKIRWAGLDEMAGLEMPPADRPLVAHLKKIL